MMHDHSSVSWSSFSYFINYSIVSFDLSAWASYKSWKIPYCLWPSLSKKIRYSIIPSSPSRRSPKRSKKCVQRWWLSCITLLFLSYEIHKFSFHTRRDEGVCSASHFAGSTDPSEFFLLIDSLWSILTSKWSKSCSVVEPRSTWLAKLRDLASRTLPGVRLAAWRKGLLQDVEVRSDPSVEALLLQLGLLAKPALIVLDSVCLRQRIFCNN